MPISGGIAFIQMKGKDREDIDCVKEALSSIQAVCQFALIVMAKEDKVDVDGNVPRHQPAAPRP